MKTLPMSLWLDLLGKPFREGARGPDAYDCVGLLLELQRRLGNDVPPYASSPGELTAALADWEPVTDPKPGDGILFRSSDPLWHIGVVDGNSWMIHSHAAIGVVRERYNCVPWQGRLEGFYRCRKQNLRLSNAINI